jgi:amino acid transporter
MKLQNRSLEEIPFKSQVGIIGSYYGLIMNCLVLVAQFWVALFPIGGPASANSFFQQYLAAPVFIVFFIFMKIYKRTKWVDLRTVDLDTGRRVTDVDVLIQQVREERAELQSHGFLYRTYRFWC